MEPGYRIEMINLLQAGNKKMVPSALTDREVIAACVITVMHVSKNEGRLTLSHRKICLT